MSAKQLLLLNFALTSQFDLVPRCQVSRFQRPHCDTAAILQLAYRRPSLQ